MITPINIEVESENGIKQTLYNYKSSSTTITSFEPYDGGAKTMIKVKPFLTMMAMLDITNTFAPTVPELPTDPIYTVVNTDSNMGRGHSYKVGDKVYFAYVGATYSNIDISDRNNPIVLSDPYEILEVVSDKQFVINKEYVVGFDPVPAPPPSNTNSLSPASMYLLEEIGLTAGDTINVNYTGLTDMNGDFLIESITANQIIVNHPYPWGTVVSPAEGTTELYSKSLLSKKKVFSMLVLTETNVSTNTINYSTDLYFFIVKRPGEPLEVQQITLSPNPIYKSTKYNFNLKTNSEDNSWKLEVKAPLQSKYKYKLEGNLITLNEE